MSATTVPFLLEVNHLKTGSPQHLIQTGLSLANEIRKPKNLKLVLQMEYAINVYVYWYFCYINQKLKPDLFDELRTK